MLTVARHSSHWKIGAVWPWQSTSPALLKILPHLGQGKDSRVMKVLSVRQPWTHGIITGVKAIENRSWQTHHRGELAIHASRSLAEFDRDYSGLFPGLPPRETLPFGAIVGVVNVTDCVPYHKVANRPFAERGGYCWLLEDPRPIHPIPWRGAQGLFDVPDAVIRAALSRALESTG
jgi:hypothetical protein